MKKCASCTKDLPDAALHCVFCGAKQPPAPAVQQSMAKTAFGYSATDLQDQLRQSAPQQGRPSQPAPGFPPPAFASPRPGVPPSQQPLGLQPTLLPSQQPLGLQPTLLPPAPSATPRPSLPMAMAATQAVPPYPGQPPAQPGFVPSSPAGAKTMFAPAPSGPPPQGSFGPASSAMPPTLVPPPLKPMPMAMPQPMQAPPMQAPMAMPAPMAIPQPQPPPYHSSPTATNVRRPIDPWRDSLRAMMFIWGVLLLIAFATPRGLKPLQFSWNVILDGAGTARLPPLMLAAVGLLGVVVAFIPMPTAARGVIAALLGLGGIAVPIAIDALPAWQPLIAMIGMLLLIPSLIVRSEYLASVFPRICVTLGAICVLLPFVVPQGGAIPLVSVFKSLIDLPGSAKVAPALTLGLITVVVMSLLAWLPSPVTGGAKLWAWLLILWTLITHLTLLLLSGNLGDTITASPHAALVPWIYGGAAPGALGAAYLVLVGYGLACVIGKRLE